MKTLKISLLKVATGLAVVAIFFGVPTAHAAATTKLTSFVRVLSYDEVMRLPKVKRQTYIRGLRAMMKEIDRVPKRLRVSNESNQYSQIASLLSLFAGDEAEAAAPGVPTTTGQGLKCGTGFQTRMVIRQAVGTNTMPAAVCVVGPRQSSKCSASTIGVNASADDGTWECATLSSFNLIPDNAKARIRTVPNRGEFLLKGFLFGGATSKFVNGQPTAEFYEKRYAQSHPRPGLQIQLVDPSKMPPRQPDPVYARAIAERDAQRARAAAATAGSRNAEVGTGTTSARASVPATAPAVAAPVSAQFQNRTSYQAVDNDGSEAIVVTPVTTSAATIATTATAAAGPVASSEEEQTTNGPEVSDDEEGASTQASATFATCQPPAAKTCDDGSVEEARRKYATDPNPDCIYAGSISTYQDGKKRAFKCVAPSQFCFGSSNCSRENGERMKPDYSCETNQVICNPLLFGVQSDGKSPFCIEKGRDATASCDDTSKADSGAVTPLDQEHTGLKEAWNDFSDRLFKLCNQNKIAAALHCAECDIISKRLFALNVAARSVASCGAAMKFEDSQCDADGKCHGLPGHPANGNATRTGRGRAVTDVGSKRFEIRGDREVSSVKTDSETDSKTQKANVHSQSDVRAKPVESVFNTPIPREK